MNHAMGLRSILIFNYIYLIHIAAVTEVVVINPAPPVCIADDVTDNVLMSRVSRVSLK